MWNYQCEPVHGCILYALINYVFSSVNITEKDNLHELENSDFTKKAGPVDIPSVFIELRSTALFVLLFYIII